MQAKTALSNALLYGCGCAFLLTMSGLVLNCDFSERSLTVAVLGFFLWANVIFGIAYCVHDQTGSDNVDTLGDRNLLKWISICCCRIVGGMFLGAYVVGLVFLWEFTNLAEVYGGAYEYLNFDAADNPVRHHYLEIYTMSGAAASGMFAGFVGVLIAPMRYGGRKLVRAGMIASAVGYIAGSFAAAIPGLLANKTISETTAFEGAIILGALVGTVAAGSIRWWASSRGLQC